MAAGSGVTAPEIGDLAAAGPFRDALLGAIAAPGPVRVDAAAVRRFGSACAQVLIAADRQLKEENRRLVIHEPSGAFADALRDLGLDADLERWSAP